MRRRARAARCLLRPGHVDDAGAAHVLRAFDSDDDWLVDQHVPLRSRSRLYVMVDFQTWLQEDRHELRANVPGVPRLPRGHLSRALRSGQVVATAQNGGALQDYFIRSANFAKLREVSLSFDAPPRLAALVGAKSLALTLTGRNLHTWTHVHRPRSGEQRHSPTAAESATIGTDQTEYPQFTSVVFVVRPPRLIYRHHSTPTDFHADYELERRPHVARRTRVAATLLAALAVGLLPA